MLAGRMRKFHVNILRCHDAENKDGQGLEFNKSYDHLLYDKQDIFVPYIIATKLCSVLSDSCIMKRQASWPL
jgi:hypothetical protein